MEATAQREGGRQGFAFGAEPRPFPSCRLAPGPQFCGAWLSGGPADFDRFLTDFKDAPETNDAADRAACPGAAGGACGSVLFPDPQREG